MIKHLLLISLVFLSLFVNAGKENFSELRELYRKQLSRYGFVAKNSPHVSYFKWQSEMWNVAAYGEEFLGQNTKTPMKNLNWLNAAIVYRVYCSYEKSSLRQRMGYSYHAVKLREQNCGAVDLETLLAMNVSPKYQELYLLYGQHCSMLLRIIEKKLFSRSVDPISLNQFISLLENKEMIEVLKNNIPTNDVQPWYEYGTECYSSGLYSIMPDEYTAARFKEILTIKIVSELNGEKEETINDIRTAITFTIDTETARNVGDVYAILTQRLWFDASPMLRPAIRVALNAFTDLSKGKINGFSMKLTKSIEMFSRDIKRSEKITNWLDIVETAVTSDSARLEPFRMILNDKKETAISKFLDEVELQLEEGKE